VFIYSLIYLFIALFIYLLFIILFIYLFVCFSGTLSIVDRKKNIFKLMQGEYVAVEYLEGVFKRSQFIGQIWVYVCFCPYVLILVFVVFFVFL
jgi:hypothetical protein